MCSLKVLLASLREVPGTEARLLAVTLPGVNPTCGPASAQSHLPQASAFDELVEKNNAAAIITASRGRIRAVGRRVE
jgi:hypothetical protein